MDISLLHIVRAATEAATEAGTAQSPLGIFGLNWKLFLAQLINFSVVLFVLWRFVFGPVVKRMQERQSKIETALSNAGTIEKEKADFESWRSHSLLAAKNEAANIVQKAKNEAAAISAAAVDEAKAAQSKILMENQNLLLAAKEKALKDLQTEGAELIVKATETMLGKTLDQKTAHDNAATSLREAARVLNTP